MLMSREPYVMWAQCPWGWYFTCNDPPIPLEDLARINPLAEWYSCQMWEAFVSKDHRHIMLLSPEEWPAQVTKRPSSAYWLDDWNNAIIDNFAPKIATMIDIPLETLVYVFWMQEQAVKCPWRLFIKYWRNFLFEDEAVLLLQEHNKTILLFNATGYVWVAQRP